MEKKNLPFKIRFKSMHFLLVFLFLSTNTREVWCFNDFLFLYFLVSASFVVDKTINIKKVNFELCFFRSFFLLLFFFQKRKYNAMKVFYKWRKRCFIARLNTRNAIVFIFFSSSIYGFITSSTPHIIVLINCFYARTFEL